MVDSFAHLGVDWSRSWGLEVFWRFSVRSVESVRHINLHTFSRDSWKSQKEKKVRAFEQMFLSHNSTGIPKFVNASRLNQKSTTLLAFYWFFFSFQSIYKSTNIWEEEKSSFSWFVKLNKKIYIQKHLIWPNQFSKKKGYCGNARLTKK